MHWLLLPCLWTIKAVRFLHGKRMESCNLVLPGFMLELWRHRSLIWWMPLLRHRRRRRSGLWVQHVETTNLPAFDLLWSVIRTRVIRSVRSCLEGYINGYFFRQLGMSKVRPVNAFRFFTRRQLCRNAKASWCHAELQKRRFRPDDTIPDPDEAQW